MWFMCLYHKALLTSLSSITCPSLYSVGILKWHTRDESDKPHQPPVAHSDQPPQHVCEFVHTLFTVFSHY